MHKWVGTGGVTAPWRPLDVAIRYTGGSTTARLVYSAPASDGGSAVTGYIITCDDGGTAGGVISASVGAGVLFYDFTNLQIGKTYAMTVTAVNAIGNGPTTTRHITITATLTAVDGIISDAFGSHDAQPRGVPSDYEWGRGSCNDANVSYTGYASWEAVNTWGQVFVPVGGSANYNVRLQARDPRIWFLRTTGWEAGMIPSGASGAMGGAYWVGDFDPVKYQDAVVRDEGDGVYSVLMKGVESGAYDTFHYWWNGMFPRIAIPTDCRGIVVRTDMRLVPEDGYTSIDGAQFISSVDADLFATQDTLIDPKGWNDGLPQARMKWVDGEWVHFYNTTLSIEDLRVEPPPEN